MVALAQARFAVGGYQRDLLERGHDFEIWRLSWLPGHATSIHDHGGVATASKVLRGRLHEETFERRRAGVVKIGESVLAPGAIDMHGPEVIHRVYALEPTISLLIYLPGSRPYRTYEVLG